MSDTYKKPKSCTGRLFGTLFAFVLAAAVVYVACYLIVFNMTGLPAANESGWLGPKLRFLATGPYEEVENANLYMGDTKPYEVFRPLNTLWLKTKDLPTTVPVSQAEEAGGDGGQGEGREGRRRGRDGAGRSRRGETASDDSYSTPPVSDRLTTGSTESESSEDRPRRRRGRRPANTQDRETTSPAE